MSTYRVVAAITLSGAALSLASTARGEEPPVPRIFTVVTATRTPQPVSSLLSDVRVIDATDIADAGTSSLTELLRAKGGVEITANGGPGQVSGVFLRGTNANHVVVLVDGVRVNSATSGTTALEKIPLTEIDHIEILRGPASSLYGADAIGGVIQIFTKQGIDGVSTSAGGGTWDTQRYTAGWGRTIGPTRFSLQAGYEHTRAFSATNARNAFSYNPDRDPYRNTNFGASVSHDWASGHTVSARTLLTEGVTHFDAGPSTDDVNKQRLATYALESRDTISSNWQSTLRLARGTDDSRVTGGFPSKFRTDQDQATWQNEFALLGGLVAAGAEYRREDVESTTAFTTTSRTIRSVFAGYSGGLGPHLLQASGRHDHNSQFGTVNTGNLAYGYRITPELRVTGSVGNAFKAPSFNDLYFSSAFFSGNPNLQPERARNYEAAIYYDSGAQRAGLTLYENRIRNLIAVDSTFTTVANINEARIRGGTAYYGMDFAGYRAKAELTHHEPINVTTGKDLVRRARDFGSFSLDKALGAWRAVAEVVAQGRRFDSAANTEASRLAGYALLNLHAVYAISPAINVSARWNNVLDKQYELVRGYNTPRSNVFVAIEYTAR
ncbi:MAG: TonB-dependent receptor [Pseudomonadota bacterium]|nr:TonB-dependent receptor [Pseudomonadota bacterium]